MSLPFFLPLYSPKCLEGKFPEVCIPHSPSPMGIVNGDIVLARHKDSVNERLCGPGGFCWWRKVSLLRLRGAVLAVVADLALVAVNLASGVYGDGVGSDLVPQSPSVLEVIDILAEALGCGSWSNAEEILLVAPHSDWVAGIVDNVAVEWPRSGFAMDHCR
jgi:hypothetical protein